MEDELHVASRPRAIETAREDGERPAAHRAVQPELSDYESKELKYQEKLLDYEDALLDAYGVVAALKLGDHGIIDESLEPGIGQPAVHALAGANLHASALAEEGHKHTVIFFSTPHAPRIKEAFREARITMRESTQLVGD